MGTTAQHLRVATHQNKNMKICLILVALVAAVSAEAFYGGIGYGYGYDVGHPTGGSFVRQSRLDGYGYGGYGGYRGKRSADAHFGYGGYGGYGFGVAGHYGGGSSYVGRTIWGLGRKKRDADADAFGYGGYGGGYGFAYNALSGNSFIARSTPIGYYPGGVRSRGRRSAAPFGGWGYDYNALSGHSFIRRSR